MQLPEYLDWLSIEVKAEYFRYIGQGPEATESVVLASQGEERLLHSVLLREIRHVTYKERYDAAEQHIAEFVTQGGYTREPRNQ